MQGQRGKVDESFHLIYSVALKGKWLLDKLYNLAEIRTCPRFYACPKNLQVGDICDQHWRHFAQDKIKYGPFLALTGK